MAPVDTHAPTSAIDVLVVDDDPDIRAYLTAALSYEGYNVQTVDGGSEALKRLQSGLPDLILLDLNMPGVTGWDVIETIQRDTLPVPVVIMTAAYRAREEAERYGAAGYLGKPFDLSTMYAMVQRALASSPRASTC